MKLLTPEYGLIFWSAFIIVSLVLAIIALMKLVRFNDMHGTTRLNWALLIILVPVLGAILFFRSSRISKEEYQWQSKQN